MTLDIKNASEWDSLVSDKKLVAADFWAPWCPYCIRLKPVFEAVAKDYGGENIQFVKINVDEQPDLEQSMEYKVYQL